MRATEEANCCCCCLCKNLRPFTMHVRNGELEEGASIFEAKRPCRCPAGCCCCQQEIIVRTREAGDGRHTKIGRVYIPCHCHLLPVAALEDAKGDKHYDIGNNSPCPFGRYKMDVQDAYRSGVGAVEKKWGERSQAFSDADVGKTVHIKGDDVSVDGFTRTVSWANAKHYYVSRRRRYVLESVEETYQGKVKLEDDVEFENGAKELFDMFYTRFPPSATPEQKAALIAAAFLLDVNFFDTADSRELE